MAGDAAQPTPGAPDRPDVDALMERVRAGVADKLARGVYTREELDRVQALALEIRQQAVPGADPADDIRLLHAGWDPLGRYEFTSHRGAVGRLIVAGKRVLRRLLAPVATILFARQKEFNGAVARLLSRTAVSVRDLEAVVTKQDLLRRQDELAARCREQLVELRRLQARLEAIERAGMPGEALAAPAVRPATPAAEAGAPAPLSYLAFEEKHRGTSEAIKRRQQPYVRHFAGAPGKVLDAGCGRGEFLELLAAAGIPAYGVDLDAEMVARCRAQGLEAVRGDLLEHLAAVPDGSLGGIFAAQVVEHMTTPDLVSFARLAHAKLAPGGRFLAETINPACLGTFSGAFYLDLTHVRPVHPEALRFLLEAVGFRAVELEFTSPFPPEMKLQEIDIIPWLRDVDQEFARIVNENFGRLNGVIYGHQDYAAVARR